MPDTGVPWQVKKTLTQRDLDAEEVLNIYRLLVWKWLTYPSPGVDQVWQRGCKRKEWLPIWPGGLVYLAGEAQFHRVQHQDDRFSYPDSRFLH